MAVRIAVDFDGVIHDPANVAPGYKMGRPVAGALEAITALRALGNDVWVFTCRDDSTGYVSAWLAYFGFHGLTVTDRKLAADVYLDDRGIRFDSWDQALGALAEAEDNR